MRVAVIGVGGVGAAACRFLARDGHTVVGYERFSVGHTRGSSHGESRIIRFAYADSLYTRLMGVAYPLWQQVESDAGEELFVRCGCAYFGPTGHSKLAKVAGALSENAVPYEWLDARETTNRFPPLRLAPDESCVFQLDAGFLRAGAVVRANARLAVAGGAVLRENTMVTAIDTDSGGNSVVVRTADGDSAHFDRAIVTAGAWTNSLFPDKSVLPLTVTRQQVTYVGFANDTARDAFSNLPVWIDGNSDWYGFPPDGRIPDGVKLACHAPGAVVDPDNDERRPELPADDAAVEYACRRFVGLTDKVVRHDVCLYTSTPDEDFVIDSPPGAPSIVRVSACSGHGFKFTVAMARLAVDRATDIDSGRFATGLLAELAIRFSASKPAV